LLFLLNLAIVATTKPMLQVAAIPFTPPHLFNVVVPIMIASDHATQ